MQLMALLTCPTCGGQTAERMPTNACAVRYTCGRCGVTVRPRPGDCCVFCSYGNVPCPPIQCAQEDQARQA